MGNEILFVGSCQTCPHDTGRCNATPATHEDVLAAVRELGAVEVWSGDGWWLDVLPGRYLIIPL
jgi:hypothetical protein